MLKKILVSLAVILLLVTSGVKAQESTESGQPVDYYLSYPGVLPDHPLYWLKMIRDRVRLILTTATLPKAEKLLLYADKRLGAGWALVEGNKIGLGVTTLTKAEKYLEKAVNLSLELGEGEKETIFKERLNKAIRKHNQVLDLLKDKLGMDLKLVESQTVEAEAGEVLEEVEVGIDFGNGEEAMELVKAGTALEALQAAAKNREYEVVMKEYDFGSMVEGVNGFNNSMDKAWIYFVNGQSGTMAADKQGLGVGDLVEWKYIKPEF